MRDVLDDLMRWWESGESIGVGTVVATFDSVEEPRQQMIDTTLPGIIEPVLEPGTRTACARFDVRMDRDNPQTEVSCKAVHVGFLGFQRRALLVWSQRQALVQTGGLLRQLRESPG